MNTTDDKYDLYWSKCLPNSDNLETALGNFEIVQGNLETALGSLEIALDSLENAQGVFEMIPGLSRDPYKSRC